MRSTLVLVALAFGLVLAAVPLPVAAHVNHVSTDVQVSPDGTLVAETAFIATDGYLAVHRDDEGEVGAAIGHVPLSSDGGLQTDVAVTVDPAVWANWSTDAVWVVLHTSDGDGQFEPESDDPVLETFGGASGTRVTVTKGDRALVTAETFAPQRLNASHTAVRIRNATLPSDGAVVVRALESGRELGRTNLSAGSHDDVSVALDESFLRANEQFAVEAVLVRDGEPVTAGDEPVATTFGVRYRGEGSTPTPALVQTATATAASDGREDPGGNSEADGDPGSTPSGGSGPGFGLLAALLALASVALLGRGRV
jgi:hypothetical protein